MVVITTHASDSWKYPKRTVNNEHWKWLLEKRRSQFRDAIFRIFEGYRWTDKELSYDLSEISSLMDTPGWENQFALAVMNWGFAAKPKGPRHVRDVLKRFYDWGQKRFAKARYYWVPAMPDFKEFIDSAPFAKKPSRRKRTKGGLKSK
jgi:hypothetical protein